MDSKQKPNFLIIMSDEHGPMFSSTYGHKIVETPNMDRLARSGVTFDAAYCNSPLCVPSRLSFLTGRHPNRIKAWDNATVLPADELTWPYALRSLGYEVVLSGKMHLLDHLHGFQRQLEPTLGGDNQKGIGAFTPWRHAMPSSVVPPWSGVPEAGPGSSQIIDHDEKVHTAAVKYLENEANTSKPFALCVGYLAPHFPYKVPEPYFSQYYPNNVDMPDIPAGHMHSLPTASRRKRTIAGWEDSCYTKDEILRARAAYFGLCSYMDQKIGHLLNVLETTGVADNTIIIYTSDHGELIGEHGLWRKNSFYEQSSRVPLQITWPGTVPENTRSDSPVSLVDLTATILEIAGLDLADPAYCLLDGDSLTPLLLGDSEGWKNEAFTEYEAPATDRPEAMLRLGNWKLCFGYGDPPELELYDLKNDPGEFNNLIGNNKYHTIENRLTERLLQIWDPNAVHRNVVASQEARVLIGEVTGAGKSSSGELGELAGWTFDPNNT